VRFVCTNKLWYSQLRDALDARTSTILWVWYSQKVKGCWQLQEESLFSTSSSLFDVQTLCLCLLRLEYGLVKENLDRCKEKKVLYLCNKLHVKWALSATERTKTSTRLNWFMVCVHVFTLYARCFMSMKVAGYISSWVITISWNGKRRKKEKEKTKMVFFFLKTFSVPSYSQTSLC